MGPHFPTPPDQPSEILFPTLPILNPAEVPSPQAQARSARAKYGGLFTLGWIGLLVLSALITWFVWGAWSLRAVWSNVYILHDATRTEAERVAAAYALAHDLRVNQRQYWDISLRKPLPPLARYVLAEALTAEAVSADPRGYALAVARSEDWPPWLRLVLSRPLAYAAAKRVPLPAGPLRELRDHHHDPMLTLWVDFALAAAIPSDPGIAARSGDDPTAHLVDAAAHDWAGRELAERLLQALHSQGAERIRHLDEATLWLRHHHPDAARLWSGWRVEGNRLMPGP